MTGIDSGGTLWDPDDIDPSEGMSAEDYDEFTEQLIASMTEPIGPRPEGAYICCFQVHYEPFEDD